jgi:hypothetical protein
MDKGLDEAFSEAKERVRLVSENLPTVVDAAFSPRAKIPFNALCFREGLMWRVEELARSALSAFERDDVVAGILLARAVMECAAAASYLRDLMKKQIERGVEPDLHDKVMRLLMGFKSTDEMPSAINVQTFVERMEKRIPGVRKMYNGMSEYAHPNWSGTQLVYSRIDRARLVTEYGRGLRDPSRGHTVAGLNGLNAGLIFFVTMYNEIADLMPEFIKLCEASLRKEGDPAS